MAMKDNFEVGFTRRGAATTQLAERIRVLTDKIKTGGMTAEEEAAAWAKFDPLIASLEAMGADPGDPIPVPVPEPEPVLI